MSGQPFQLTRYFTVTSLVAFAVLGGALVFLQHGQAQYFERVQAERTADLARTQAELLREQRESARASLVAVHEAGHVALARVFANALWTSHLAPLVQQARSVAVEPCRPAATPPCAARLRRQVAALPAFAGVDAPVRALMRSTNVFKIKVYDQRGLTVYSSELAQVGEDKAGNAGWRTAAAGRTASELVHRDRFSAFEGVVHDRDLIQSYIPVAAPGGGVAGVFEIYSDVTPLMQQLQDTAARSAALTARSQERMAQAAAAHQAAVQGASTRFVLTIIALLVLAYGVLLFFVRSGQRLIDREARAREQAALREQEWHRDKMATLQAMADNIAHQVGNPLASIQSLAERMRHWRRPEDVDRELPLRILEHAARMREMTQRLNDFAQAGGRPEAVDVNRQVEQVSQILTFDRRFHGTTIALQLGADLPRCRAIPDQLTEVLMGVLQASEQGCADCPTPGAGIHVETGVAGGEVKVRIARECAAAGASCRVPPTEPRLESARRRLAAMEGRVLQTADALEIRLPCAGA